MGNRGSSLGRPRILQKLVWSLIAPIGRTVGKYRYLRPNESGESELPGTESLRLPIDLILGTGYSGNFRI